MRSLDPSHIEQFICRGFVKLENAFPREVAEEALAILWRDTGCNPNEPLTWTRPVIRLGQYRDAPFMIAANSPRLTGALDLLVGPERWSPLGSVGTFPVRFPSHEDPGDTGWHVDASFDFEQKDFMQWRVNVFSRGRALLMLFLFSDVGDQDAPTRIRSGSHREIARMLTSAGRAGMTLRELAQNGFDETAHCAEIHATGEAGTVYLCHPFLVHAAQTHRGTRPRFVAQPPLLPAQPLLLDREHGSYSPVETAIREAILSRR